jgi:hypothetical protein
MMIALFPGDLEKQGLPRHQVVPGSGLIFL